MDRFVDRLGGWRRRDGKADGGRFSQKRRLLDARNASANACQQACVVSDTKKFPGNVKPSCILIVVFLCVAADFLAVAESEFSGRWFFYPQHPYPHHVNVRTIPAA